MRDFTLSRNRRTLWLMLVSVAALIGVAIGLAAGVDCGAGNAAKSADAEVPATKAPAATSTPRRTPSGTPEPTPTTAKVTPEPIVFTGRGGKATETFTIRGQRFSVRWTTEVSDPGAFFFLSVFTEGQEFPVAEASFRGGGSDSTVVRAGPGQFYIEVVTGATWRIEVEPE